MPETFLSLRADQLYERYHRFLIGVVNTALVITLAWLLSMLVWAWIPIPEAAQWQPPQPLNTPQSAAPRTQVDPETLIKAQLFGTYQRSADPSTQESAEDAPDTRLSVTLLGILAGDEHGSRALISKSNGEEKPFAIGDEVISGAKLHAIFADRVVLIRAGKFETLRLNKDAPSKAQVNVARSQPAITAQSVESGQMLAQIRQQIMADPTKAANFLRVQPAMANGMQRGYRIYPGREREAFQKLGLRPGDLITSINGVQLDDNQKALQLLGDLSQASAVSVTLERGGQVQTLNLTLN